MGVAHHRLAGPGRGDQVTLTVGREQALDATHHTSTRELRGSVTALLGRPGPRAGDPGYHEHPYWEPYCLSCGWVGAPSGMEAAFAACREHRGQAAAPHRGDGA